jgi:hypothetical protein
VCIRSPSYRPLLATTNPSQRLADGEGVAPLKQTRFKRPRLRARAADE